ncbi:MAG: N-acetylmuramoyl-L-alanine amidase [Proteobacteria bacterium]|nr:N-acetylmuramoyl-L-alanine amidase [Pseudomonadota bacterium]
MIQRSFIYLIIALNVFVLSMSASNSIAATDETSRYEDARTSYYALKNSAKTRKFRHNWIKVMEKYKKVVNKYPKGKWADESLFMIAKLYKELHPYSGNKGDIKKSNEYSEKLARNYPESNLADDALFMMGENYEKLGKEKSAYNSFILIVEKYKEGDQVADARNKVIKLKKSLSLNLTSGVSPGKKSSAVSPPVKADSRHSSEKQVKVGGKRGFSNVTEIRHWSNPHYTRIVVQLDSQSKYHAHLLRQDPSIGKPPRLYVDIFGARKKGSLKEEIPINDGLLKRARAAQYDNDTVRVVLDIESIKDYKIFPMLDPFRIIIDVRGGEALTSPTIESLIPGNAKDKKSLQAALEEENLSLSRQLGLGVRKIVIDAGHGGKDPGAIGRGKTREKDVNLKIAKALKRKLEKNFNYDVVLTRSTDRYLRLEERTAIANMENADLFISIHANANRNKKAHGIETYVMNARASDRFAAEVAARENAVTSHSQGEFGSVLEAILVDMSKTNKVNESNKLASSIQTNIRSYMSKRYTSVKNLGVKRGPFYVLIGANMPSILVETGFITNRREEKRLRNNKYIDSLTNAIALGIDKYAKVIKIASNI